MKSCIVRTFFLPFVAVHVLSVVVYHVFCFAYLLHNVLMSILFSLLSLYFVSSWLLLEFFCVCQILVVLLPYLSGYKTGFLSL